ncbi:hypothetical protein IV54_GL000568 [Levilactobacillus paucivorans]|uniref:Uncharacterized protein n=1 Tax=Levilactobacillus paucivorans TaxID=616990 RepID=A0A0R2LGH6_9LACO|nr:hypothetical protein IV54_GL000568 [Levilactobacillus paucivorans]
MYHGGRKPAGLGNPNRLVRTLTETTWWVGFKLTACDRLRLPGIPPAKIDIRHNLC